MDLLRDGQIGCFSIHAIYVPGEGWRINYSSWTLGPEVAVPDTLSSSGLSTCDVFEDIVNVVGDVWAYDWIGDSAHPPASTVLKRQEEELPFP